MLKVDDLEVGYGDLQVVWGVSFEVPEKSIVAILGPNGAGKTTTLLALMGLLPVIGGTIALRGEEVTGARTHAMVDQGVVMIPEERAAFSGLTVRDNLKIGAYNRRARGQMEQTLDEVLGIFPVLGERQAQYAATLSGGERQMLAIAKALMAKPDLLVLDEPSLGLAPIIVERTFDVIRRIRETGVSVLMVEQHVEMTLELVDYAYILELGKVVDAGTSEELMRHERVRDAYLGL